MTDTPVRTIPANEQPIDPLLGWIAVAVIVAEFLLIPLRTARWAPEWRGTVAPYALWAGGLLVLWVAIPMALLRWQRRRSRTHEEANAGEQDGALLPFSVLPPRTSRGIALYGALVVVMVPLLVIASRRADFGFTYPLLHPANGAWTASLLLAYWCCYVLVLFSTEFLFRGVLLFSLEPRLGVHAVGVSVLPYCLIHVHKPFAEALGSIVAGYVLGILALRTRSIGGGVLVHCGVAITMDALALTRTHAWPVGW